MNTQRWPTTPRILRITRTTKRLRNISIRSLPVNFSIFSRPRNMAKFIPETESLRESIYALFAALPDPSHFARVLLLFVARERSIAPFDTCIFSIFFFFFGTIARTEKILVRRLLFTIIKKNCETMERERNWICKRLIREIIIKREVSESFETFDRDESDSLHEGIKKKNLQYVSSFKYFPTLRRRL